MKIVAKNKRARFDYEITSEVEAGVMLTGQEVKSARSGGMNLAGSYISLVTGKPVLKSASIQPYKHASNLGGYDTGHDRMLLLTKKQISKLIGAAAEKGISILPLEVRAGRHIKVLIGIGRGRKRIDKRQRIKEREISKKMKKGEEY